MSVTVFVAKRNNKIDAGQSDNEQYYLDSIMNIILA